MSTISSLGVGSGLDIKSIVQQLVQAERAPAQTRIDNQQQRLEAEVSAYGKVKSALSEFQSTVSELRQADSFISNKATSSSDAISVSADSSAEEGTYAVGVSQLAAAQSAATGAFADRDNVVGTGTLTFRFGDVTTDADGNVTDFTQNADRGTRSVEIDTSSNTLSGIRDAVNDADIGIRASIVDDGSGDRLVFSSAETGKDNGFLVDVDADDSTSDLSRLAFNETNAELEQTREGLDAQLSVDGLAITRSSNSIDDLFQGVTLDLQETTTSDAEISISRDSDQARSQVEGFVEAFNTLQGQIAKLTGYNAETEQAGPLNGDSAVRGIIDSLRNELTSRVEVLEGRPVRAMADIGVLTKRDGSLELDSDRLDSALEQDPEAVTALFSAKGIVEGDGFSFESSRSTTEPGEYAIQVDSLATRGVYQGDGVLPGDFSANPVEVQDGDNTFEISVDGTRSETISIRPGTYDNGDELAREIQSVINGDDNLVDNDREVFVDYNAGANRFDIRSQRYGSESTVNIVAADAGVANDLGLSVADGTAGTDVQGSIDGAAAEGFGQYLTAQSGPAEGLKVQVDGGQTGELGSVLFSRGIMSALDSRLDDLIGADGSLDSRTSSLNNRLDGLEEDRADLDDRMARVEERYTRQFSSMDSLVAELQRTGNFLQQQLGSGGMMP
ncbi:flagellar filament capping protein FliD [Aquisalimonas lutea]|uniref:flagellar filament capping protein FliD n=1 Tax=Aquisalimonas lutea TaxID=1327750 RepID=UPI0025B5BEFC|nr:flagellar filament capping protein FliD [Aquisalimonas lutea]MDN3518274.1 flagellar filament capping protein FliD [Aquisalimonas lutea]